MNLKNKKLLIISYHYPSEGGADYSGQFVKSQADEISNHFKYVNVIVPTPYVPCFLKNFKFIFPKKYYYLYNSIFLKNYSYKNISVHYVHQLVPYRFFKFLFPIYKKIINYIKFNKIDFDLIHAHFLFSGIIANKINNHFNKPYVITIQENRQSFKKSINSNNPSIISALKNASYLIRVNKKDLEDLKIYNKNLINIENTYPNYCYPMKNKLTLKNKLKVPVNKKIILNVANYLIWHKNQLNLIYAINILKDIRQDFILYLIGRGKDELIIKNKIKELGLDNYIKLLGPKKNTDVPIWMNISDLFVLPSYFEGNPTVLFESLACGIPFIGSKIAGGMEEIITSDDFGFILDDPNNFKNLAELINISLDKKWNTIKIRHHALKYSPKNICKKNLKIYSEVLK